ncbi:MAG TPA: type II toxin-antitoxin system RelE/ParE family toxin [Thermoanaerobaculia bacterium]|nr:type II toxin-antitoxin system RelE/ParE family toxin [Thermoanaerobaculia bacterium]
MSFSFHPAARAEYLEAITYYERQSPGLGDDFAAAFEAALSFVRAHPQAAPLVHPSGVRRKSFPAPFLYSLLYAPEPSGLLIVAVAHHRKRPEYWRSRTGAAGPRG